MNIFIGLLLAGVFGNEEGLSEEEKNDEVAQEQTRSKWIACLMLGRQIYEEYPSMIDQYASQRNVKPGEINKKISADVLAECNKKIDWKVAAQMLSNDRIDLTIPEIESFSKFDITEYSSKDLALTDEQRKLFEDIEHVRGI